MPNPFNFTPQDAPNFSPNRPGAMQGGQDMSFLEDPQFQTEFQKVLDSTPGLAEAMSSDSDLANHIMGSLAARQPLPLGVDEPQAQPTAPGMPDSTGNPFQGFDVGAVGGARPGMAPAQQAPDEEPMSAGPRGEAPPANFREYLNSQNGKDDFMMGLIMSNYGQNPEKALELAMQFKQRKDLLKQAAEQNELQREATRENIKLKKEMDKQEKEDKLWQKEAIQGEAALRTAGVDPNEIISKLGPWGRDNSGEWKTEVTRAVHDKKASDAKMKKEETDFKNMEGIASRVYTTGNVIPSRYTRETLDNGKPNPDYKPDFNASLETIAANRKEMQKIHNDNDKAHLKLMEMRGKAESGKMSDTQKASLRVNFGDLQNIYARVMQAKRSMDAYKPFSEGKNPFGEAYQSFVADYNEAMGEYKAKATEIGGSIKGFEEMPTAGANETPIPTAAPTAAPAAAAIPAAAAAPSAKPTTAQMLGYRRLLREGKMDPKALLAKWNEMFPGIEPPSAE